MKRKLERFEIIAGRENVIQPGKEIYGQIKGNWNELHFKNSNPITVELACGRGEYTIGLAKLFPERNFIGVDIKGDRIWKGSTLAVENKLCNVGFLRTHILMIENFFDPGEIGCAGQRLFYEMKQIIGKIPGHAHPDNYRDDNNDQSLAQFNQMFNEGDNFFFAHVFFLSQPHTGLQPDLP